MEQQGLRMLDHALELAHKELLAIKQEAYTDAIELGRQRSSLTNEAWNFYDDRVREEYRSRLLQLSLIHAKLTSLAFRAHEEVRVSLLNSRREQRRMSGYQRAVSQALQ